MNQGCNFDSAGHAAVELRAFLLEPSSGAADSLDPERWRGRELPWAVWHEEKNGHLDSDLLLWGITYEA
ncbi:MAG: hypothetical protein ACTHK1_14595, partial [Actinomycetales bacterium]